MKTGILVFDVESVGLHGPGFAFGYVLIDFEGKVIQEDQYGVDPISLRVEDVDGLHWVMDNVKMEYNCKSVEEVRAAFWALWMSMRSYTILAADVTWPVETNFLEACINDDLPTRRWQGPYPLLDIASFRFGDGCAAMETEERLPNELPAHNPLNDARQSARQLNNSMRDSFRFLL